ncbi:lycopene cyclase domain-containing protein [Corynebacterium halotolerans]|uniref:C50 carotenoid epsilon cyclase n=1 Tax=Corynebacterium halotolerans YIM 70093 = DSM 44683 TaxID=1121362 RepID=M1NQD1_9CORY|nr:lycopene cyclase domain-containing protein [Corynebacterium halotolerans]AGF71717.1 C50 carotenoid epsilon cyclase [Corynebacterium halotolerans YIM 70093 = DSM 44683]
MTYLLISLPFLILGAVVWLVRRNSVPRQLAVTALVAAVLLVLTAIFDNLMIWADLFGYGDAQRLGPQIGLAPVEDFFYPLFAALIIPAVWTRKPESERRQS